MFWVFSILLLLSGCVVFADIIKKKSPGAGAVLDFLVGSSGWMGVALFVVGIINLLDAIRMLQILSMAPVLVLVTFASVVVAILLGGLLAISVIKTFASDKSGIEKIENKLMGIKIPLGILAIVCSLYLMIAVQILHLAI